MKINWAGARLAARAFVAATGAWLALEPIGVCANALTVALSERTGIRLGENKPLGAGDVVAGISFGDAALRKLGAEPKVIVLALPATPGSAVRNVVID